MKTLSKITSMLFISVMLFEGQLHIVDRMNAGTLEKDVSLSQGEKGRDIQLVGATSEQTQILYWMHAQKVARNMTAMRKHVACVGEATGVKGSTCKVASPL